MSLEVQSVNKQFEQSFRKNWDRPALSNIGGPELKYSDFARLCEELHLIFSHAGINRGDRISICSRNQANWAVAFMSVMTYGAVPVPLLHEFGPVNIHHLVEHSDSRILFVDEHIWATLDIAAMPGLLAVILVDSLKVVYCTSDEAFHAQEHITELMAEKYPDGFNRDCLDYYNDSPQELAIINYTSGTSGFSKGVMLSYRNLRNNLYFAKSVHGEMDNTRCVLAILPSAHMYGLMFEILFQIFQGVHIYFLTRVPSPNILLKAMQEVKPDLVISVPLIIEKIYKNIIRPQLESKKYKFLSCCVPGFRPLMYKKIREKIIDSFGGRFSEIIIGGAALNKDVETFFHNIRLPFTVGYGMTECCPIITYSPWNKAKVGSSGYAAPNMELRIDSEDPRRVPGEIQCRGDNVFIGYVKNEEATKESFTSDGWFRTGDMGVIDKDGYLFIRGRNKCMILGPNGQNIYPEELEAVINNVDCVAEALVVEDNGGLAAIVYPDFQKGAKRGMDNEAFKTFVENEVRRVSTTFPGYAKIKTVRILDKDFERTPKKSIKRYLYQSQ